MTELNITVKKLPTPRAPRDVIVIDRTLALKAFLLILPALCVVTAAVFGSVILTTFGRPIFTSEMIAGLIINVIGGMFAIGLLIMMMDRGVVAISRAAMMSIGLRMSGVLIGTMLAMGPGWGLLKMPLIYWVLVGYFVLLIAESWVGIFLVRRAKF